MATPTRPEKDRPIQARVDDELAPATAVGSQHVGLVRRERNTELPATPSDADARSRIEQTLTRIREVDAAQVRVWVDDHIVTLSGRVRCWSEHQIVEQVAWSAPGVVHVNSHVVIAY